MLVPVCPDGPHGQGRRKPFTRVVDVWSSCRCFHFPTSSCFPTSFCRSTSFEPRYREMVADALANDRMIGMVLLRPGWDRDYEGRPPIYSVGCSGVLTHNERLPDGRYNIVLRGIERFRIVVVDHGLGYRRAGGRPAARPRARGRRPLGQPAASGRSWSRCSAGASRPPAIRACRLRCRTKTWSTRWRSTSTSNRSRSRRCSRKRRCARAPSPWSSCSR